MIKIRWKVENELTWNDATVLYPERRKYLPGDILELLTIQNHLVTSCTLCHLDPVTRLLRFVEVPNDIFEYVS